jgi:hypothetical protein
VEQELAAFERSPQAGCVAAGTPAVEIALIHLWDAEARDSMPPRVEAVGVGSCAAGSVPAVMLEAFVASVEHEFAALPEVATGWLRLMWHAGRIDVRHPIV